MQKTHWQHKRKLQKNCSSNLLDYKGVLYHTVIMSSSSQNTLCYISMINSFHVTLYMFVAPTAFYKTRASLSNVSSEKDSYKL